MVARPPRCAAALLPLVLAAGLGGCQSLGLDGLGGSGDSAEETRQLKREIATLRAEIADLSAAVRQLTAAEPASVPAMAPPSDRAQMTAPAPQASAARTAAPSPAEDPPRAEPAARADGSEFFSLHLASYRSVASARAGWDTLKTRFAPALAELEPRLERVDLPGRGRFFRLKAGPFLTFGAAEAGCAPLRAEGWLCSVMDYAGEPLSAERPSLFP